jgi:death-on-curing protein
MIYLTAEQILFIHHRLIVETGGSQGLRDLGLLESAVGRPKATFDRRELYPDAFAKAAALMHSLIKNHAFVDGNKRTGIAAAIIFLQINHVDLRATGAEIEQLALEVAKDRISMEEAARWFKQHRQAKGKRKP